MAQEPSFQADFAPNQFASQFALNAPPPDPRPQNFAKNFGLGNQSPPSPGFSEQNIEDPVIGAAQGAIEAADDQTLSEVPKILGDQNSVQALMMKADRDASGEGGFTDSLTTTEKVALATLAILPLLGGALGGEEGALMGVGATGQGIAVAAKAELEDQRLTSAAMAKNKTEMAKSGRDTKVLDRKITKDLLQEWRKDPLANGYREIKGKLENIQDALKKSGGIRDTVAIVDLFKIIDENSAVKEGEAQLIADSQGLHQRFLAFTEKYEGTRLGPEAKQEIMDIARGMVHVRKRQLDARANEFRREATELGIDPNVIVPQSFFEVPKSSGSIPSFSKQESSPTNKPLSGGDIVKNRLGTFKRTPSGKLIKVGD